MKTIIAYHYSFPHSPNCQSTILAHLDLDPSLFVPIVPKLYCGLVLLLAKYGDENLIALLENVNKQSTGK